MASEPTWLNRAIVEALRADQVVEHGGRAGIRDEGMLELAPARPKQKWHYEPSTDLASLSAAYAFAIAKNHPFVDGNKRAALVAAYTFLAVNDLELEAPEPEAVSMIVGIADGSLSEDELASWIRTHVVPWVD